VSKAAAMLCPSLRKGKTSWASAGLAGPIKKAEALLGQRVSVEKGGGLHKCLG
jgi:hypothetical protein